MEISPETKLVLLQSPDPSLQLNLTTAQGPRSGLVVGPKVLGSSQGLALRLSSGAMTPERLSDVYSCRSFVWKIKE